MKDISCIKHGTIYKANPRDLERWARKIAYPNPYEQAYGQFIRVEVVEGEHAGESWMIDTWDIENFYIDKLERTRDLTEIGSSDLYSFRWHAYYNSCVQLLPENVDLFEELCDLHDFELLSERSDTTASHYKPEDIVSGVWIANEYKYPNGATLVRKGADVNTESKARVLFKNVKYEYERRPVSYKFKYELRVFYKYAMEHHDAACIQNYLPLVDDMARKSEAAEDIVYDKKAASGQLSFDF